MMDFILGSGIVGVVSSFYLRDYTILAKGRGQDSARIGPKIIRKTQYTESFVSKINKRLIEFKLSPIKSREFKCAYYSKGKLNKTISPEETKQYIIKTRGENNIEKFTQNALNDGMINIEGYYMDEIYNALTARRDVRNRRMFMKIDKIDSKKHRIEGSNPSFSNIRLSVNYSNLINTLPAHIFNSFVTGEKIGKVNHGIIIYIIKSRDLFQTLGENDFVYYLDKNIPYYRMTKIGNNILAMESKNLFFTRNFLKERHTVLQTIKLPFGKINDDLQPKQRINIKHIGRYANNDNSLRVHNIIESFEKGEIEF